MHPVQHPLTSRAVSAWGLLLVLALVPSVPSMSPALGVGSPPTLEVSGLRLFNQAQRCGLQSQAGQAPSQAGHCLKCWVLPLGLDAAPPGLFALSPVIRLRPLGSRPSAGTEVAVGPSSRAPPSHLA